jgi:hypothetical protein
VATLIHFVRCARGALGPVRSSGQQRVDVASFLEGVVSYMTLPLLS